MKLHGEPIENHATLISIWKPLSPNCCWLFLPLSKVFFISSPPEIEVKKASPKYWLSCNKWSISIQWNCLLSIYGVIGFRYSSQNGFYVHIRKRGNFWLSSRKGGEIEINGGSLKIGLEIDIYWKFKLKLFLLQSNISDWFVFKILNINLHNSWSCSCNFTNVKYFMQFILILLYRN